MSDQRLLCDVCRGDYTVADFTQYNDVCEHHKQQRQEQDMAKRFREWLPPCLMHAEPHDLPAALAQWTGEDSTGLYLYGPVGSGKSHAAAALAKQWQAHQPYEAMFGKRLWANVPRVILDTLGDFAGQRDPSERWEKMEKADLLVLDDIGIETPKDWVRMRLYALIEHRLNYRLPMIVTSNLDLGQLSERLESPQIASRIAQVCMQFSFEGSPDRRLAAL